MKKKDYLEGERNITEHEFRRQGITIDIVFKYFKIKAKHRMPEEEIYKREVRVKKMSA